jgi:hypothetical protein
VTVDTVAVTFTCSATNAGGTTSEAVTIKRDTVAPVSTPSTTPSVNPNGWYRTDVVVFWTGTDATSGIASCATSEVMMAEGAGQSSGVGTCTDNAGLVSEGTQLVGINVDKTAPDLPTVTPSSSNNANGWYNTDVTATWTGTDALSGIAFCTAPQTISSEGAGQSTVLGRCTDLAGNVSDGIQIVGINIDKTPPTVSAKVPASGSVVPRRSLILVSYSCADTLSGIDPGGCEGTQPNGSPLDTRKRVKRAVFVIAATDLAGNTTTEIVRYEISPKEESR